MESLDTSIGLSQLDLYTQNLLQHIRPPKDETEKEKFIKQGYNLNYSIREKYKILIENLALNIKDSNLDFEDFKEIIENWDRLVQIIESQVDLSKFTLREKLIYLAASTTYWEVYSEIYSDMTSQTKEGKKFSVELIDAELKAANSLEARTLLVKLRAFAEHNKFKQRSFENTLDQKRLRRSIDSAVRAYGIKKHEREYVELLNLLKLWELKFGSSQELIDAMEAELNLKIENDLRKEIGNFENINLSLGDVFVEFSPPIYKHQEDIMVRVYEMTAAGWQSKIFSLPYNPEALAQDIQALRQLSIATPQPGNLRHSENKILADTFLIRGISAQAIIKNLQLVQSSGGIEMLELNDQIIVPKLKVISEQIHPYIKSLMSELPYVVKNPSSLAAFTDRYQDMLNAAYLTFRPTTQDISTVDQQKIDAGLLKSVASGESINSFVSSQTDIGKNSPNGKVELLDKSECGEINIQIKREDAKSAKADAKTEQSDAKSTVSSDAKPGFEMANFEKVIGKNSEVLEFFDKYNKKTKKVERHIKCTVCGEGSIDVCDMQQKCPNCGTLGSVMKDAYDKGILHELKDEYEHKVSKSHTEADFKSAKHPAKIDNVLDHIVRFKWLLP